MGQHTLKISIEHNSDSVFVKLEGRVTGPWAVELQRVWQTLQPPVMGRRVVVDLCDVTFVDAQGNSILRTIHNETGAIFEANSPLTDYFAAEATQDEQTHGAQQEVNATQEARRDRRIRN